MNDFRLVTITKNTLGDIVIRIPKSYLSYIAPLHESLPENSKVTNQRVFRDAVLWELEQEEEDGSNMVHRMVDQAILNAVEMGCEGIELGDE